MKILLVDDSVATLDSFVALFEAYGYVTFTSHNVAGALTSLGQRQEINLVICDYYMHGEDGFSLCAKIRSTGRQVPILLLTAADDGIVNQLRESCNMLGNILVIRKPVDPDILVKLVAEIKSSGNVAKR